MSWLAERRFAGGNGCAQAGARLAGYLKSLGVQYVLDLSSARDVSLMEAAAEFCQRFRFASSNAAGQMEIDGTEAQSATAGPLPMLASACPGCGTCRVNQPMAPAACLPP